jgi:hypothetical protein
MKLAQGVGDEADSTRNRCVGFSSLLVGWYGVNHQMTK